MSTEPRVYGRWAVFCDGYTRATVLCWVGDTWEPYSEVERDYRKASIVAAEGIAKALHEQDKRDDYVD